MVSKFGSVAKADVLASCLQRFKVSDANLARSNGFKCVLGIVERAG